MKKNLQIEQIVVVTLIIVLGAIARILSIIPNVTPVAAMALFGAAMFPRRWMSLVVPIFVMLISDFIIGFYSLFLMSFVYFAFLCTSLLGLLLKKNINFIRVVMFSLLSSVSFFIITNFGVWAEGLWYPMTFEGLIQTYVMAIPFFRYELLGTLGYSLLFFGLYELYKKYVFNLAKNSIK
ncbi:MAG: hypothetical protein N2Z72_06905 [Bacteroidales bacterium]|nr:hypothetical protein [Bacteroidales bacterium]